MRELIILRRKMIKMPVKIFQYHVVHSNKDNGFDISIFICRRIGNAIALMGYGGVMMKHDYRIVHRLDYEGDLP